MYAIRSYYADGLALSSRNHRLTPTEREVAPTLAKVMGWIASQIEQGERDWAALQQQASP